MIKTTAMLMDELKAYANPTAKIRRLVASGELIAVVRGLYETDRNVPGCCLSGSIYGPSYLSFEFALSYYSLIPETVYPFTAATFEKKRQKRYTTPYGVFTYRDVPSQAYPYGITLHEENGYGFQLASPEKALCDRLYTVSPVKNRAGLEALLFQDLRIDSDAFWKLDMVALAELADCYSTENHRLMKAYSKKGAQQ